MRSTAYRIYWRAAKGGHLHATFGMRLQGLVDLMNQRRDRVVAHNAHNAHKR
ncbi:MAG: hypothetical protein ACE5KF_07145 [Kiloniellaceae bacterium]